MAKKKNTPVQQSAPVGPLTADLKGRFQARSIPLETDFSDLIDVADCGRKAAGLSPDVPAITNSGLILDSSNGQLKVLPEPDMGISVNNNGISVVVDAAKEISVTSNGIGISVGLRAVPIGTIMMWPSSNIPLGWLLCDGESYSKEQYPILGSIFIGESDFNVPDFSNRYPVGFGNELPSTVNTIFPGRTGMPDGLSILVNSAGKHTHSYSRPVFGGSDDNRDKSVVEYIDTAETSSAGEHSHGVEVGSNFSSAQTRPNSIVMNFIIACD